MVGRKHLLEMNRKCLSFFVVSLGPASVRISEWRDQYLGSFESLRSLPEGVVIRREGGEIMYKGIIIGIP
jgi:hypothetical protein